MLNRVPAFSRKVRSHEISTSCAAVLGTRIREGAAQEMECFRLSESESQRSKRVGAVIFLTEKYTRPKDHSTATKMESAERGASGWTMKEPTR
jgi:hypothetical protein